MTSTTGRALALLGLLQSRPAWSGAELRDRLEISERTLRRDVDELRELGFGVIATRGRHGGYRLGPGASVPPLALSRDEAVAIAVGLRAAAVSVVTGIEDASARALAKLEQSLSAATRQRIADVGQALVPLSHSADQVDLDAVTAIARAIEETREIRVDYTKHEGERVHRHVEPHRIVHTPTRWYLVARDVDKGAWRTLRIDRVHRVIPLRDTFPRREIPEDALRTFTTRSITIAPYACRATVRMYATADEVSRHFGPTVAEVVDGGDGTSVLTAGSHSPADMALYLGSSGIDFEILEGDAVRAELQVLAERFVWAAEPQSGR